MIRCSPTHHVFHRTSNNVLRRKEQTVHNRRLIKLDNLISRVLNQKDSDSSKARLTQPSRILRSSDTKPRHNRNNLLNNVSDIADYRGGGHTSARQKRTSPPFSTQNRDINGGGNSQLRAATAKNIFFYSLKFFSSSRTVEL